MCSSVGESIFLTQKKYRDLEERVNVRDSNNVYEKDENLLSLSSKDSACNASNEMNISSGNTVKLWYSNLAELSKIFEISESSRYRS